MSARGSPPALVSWLAVPSQKINKDEPRDLHFGEIATVLWSQQATAVSTLVRHRLPFQWTM